LAAENKYNALVFPLSECCSGLNREYIRLAEKHSFIIEAGGHDLSILMPRRLFLFHRNLFRMDQGKRKIAHHFCTTNPKTIAIITERARYLFSRSLRTVTEPRIFHLMPDEGHEETWCACPACRAFSFCEQYIIAVNSAADALAKIDPEARLAFMDFGEDPQAPGMYHVGIGVRANMVKI